MTFWSSVVSQMPQQLVLLTAGRLKLVAPILTANLRTPAVSVWIMVGLTHFVSRLALWVLQKGWYCGCVSMTEKYAQHWCSMLSDPQGVFAPCHSEISPDSYKEVSPLLQLLHSSVDCTLTSLQISHYSHNTLHFILSPHRTASMTAVTVRKVRTACVLQSPLMSMHVQL